MPTFVVAPTHAPPMASHAIARANTLVLLANDEAKAAWLAKLDTPAWSAAANAMRALVDEAGKMAETSDSTALLSKEEEAKQKWLASLDLPSWGEAATAIESMVEAENTVVVDVPGKMSEDEAKAAWLAKLDVPKWGKITEEEAKKKWLAKLEADAPVWGAAASAMITVAAEATKMAELTEDCDSGVSEACELLSKEDEAKIAWLKKLEVPSWGKTPEEQAKAKWLAKLETPSWGQLFTVLVK